MKNKLTAALALVPLLAAGILGAGVANAQTTMMTSSTMMASTTMPMTTTSMPSSMNMPNNMMAVSGYLWTGSQGADVVSLQTFLTTEGFLTIPSGTSMGYFGPLTKAALMKYQASQGISSTGYFGPLTKANVNAALSAMSQGVQVGGAAMVANLNIVQNALNASNVTTLVAAVKAAGLVSTLEGSGPFTVFAPDNGAFAKIPSSTIASLLMPANQAQLVDILTYHVVSGRYTSASLYNGEVLKTVEGKTLTITKSASGQISVNGTAMVETPDVFSSNGVTFVIDTVLMPPANQ
jgi:uncharacterized surface protein with fasciclin (FAS1) repeats